MAILLIAEHDNKSLKGATAKALSAATAIGPEVHILVAGKDCRPAAEAAAKLAGVAKVLVAAPVAIWSQSWSRCSTLTPTATGPANLQLMPWARLASAAGATIGFLISTSRVSSTALI